VVTGSHPAAGNSADEDNNRLLISQLAALPPNQRTGKFVCVLAAATDGVTLRAFHGEVGGQLLTLPRGSHGFGYDPLFYFPDLGKTFAEISADEKARYSHRGQAFRKFLDWYRERL
jgi:XTP/dITP diphosphohydrolase